MNRTALSTILAGALVCGLGLPAQAARLPGADPAEGTPGATAAVVARAMTPAEAASLRPVLRIGSRSPAVVFVQTALGVKPASGYFGPITARAVRRAQVDSGLKSTGRVTARTWRVLLRAKASPTPAPADPVATTPAAAAAAASAPAAQPTAPTPEQAAAGRPALAPGVGPGDPGVIFVQRFLRVSPATGFFGKLTTNAVRSYQAGLGIPISGRVDTATWDAILAGRTVTPTQPPTPATPTPAALTSAAPTPAASTPPKPKAPAAATIPTPTFVLPANPTAADRALSFALAQVGKPYVLGRNGPDAFDCSSLTQQAYLTAGVRLPRLASVQRFAGTEVSIDALLPGDLLYYQDGPSPRKGHISMYAGDGLVVEAANPRRGVRIRTLHETWFEKRFVAAVRIP